MFCNKCGKRVDDSSRIQSISLDFGYGSDFDNDNWSFELCEDCLLCMVKEFKFIPDGFCDVELRFAPDEKKQELFEGWKETGEWESMKFMPYDELVELCTWYDKDYINKCIVKYHPEKPILR